MTRTEPLKKGVGHTVSVSPYRLGAINVNAILGLIHVVVWHAKIIHPSADTT